MKGTVHIITSDPLCLVCKNKQDIYLVFYMKIYSFELKFRYTNEIFSLFDLHLNDSLRVVRPFFGVN